MRNCYDSFTTRFSNKINLMPKMIAQDLSLNKIYRLLKTKLRIVFFFFFFLMRINLPKYIFYNANII